MTVIFTNTRLEYERPNEQSPEIRLYMWMRTLIYVRVAVMGDGWLCVL